MRIEEAPVGDVTLVAFSGEFDAHHLSMATEKLDALFESMRNRLIFNIGGLDFITSTALAFFIDAVKRARALRGEVVITQPTKLFEKTTSALDIESFFHVFPTNADALAYFRVSGEADADA